MKSLILLNINSCNIGNVGTRLWKDFLHVTGENTHLMPWIRMGSAVFQTDFLAVEMRRGKVALLWDLGSGSTRVEYPDLQIDNNKWHRIHATR